MNLLAKLGQAGGFIKKKAVEAVKTVRAEFGESLAQPVRDTVAQVRANVSEGVRGARAAAAEAIAEGAAGAGVQIAGRVAPKDHWTQRASAFLNLDPRTRTVVIWTLIALAAALIFAYGRKK